MLFHPKALIVLLLAAAIPDSETLTIQPSNNHRLGSFPTAFTAFRGNSQYVVPSESSTRLRYEPGDEGKGSVGNEISGVWSALAKTEQWISDTIAKSARAGSNPYSRKEVSYVCETTDETLMAVANIFRRVKEARELGKSHSVTEEAVVMDKGPDYMPSTLRQTQVVVIPSCQYFDSFQDFEDVIQAVNAARKSARDYVTDIAVERMNRESKDLMDRDWIVSVSMASLHPKYGEKSPEEVLLEMKKEEEEGEVDLNLKAYKEHRKRARQSPYPSVILELKALPPPDFLENPSHPQTSSDAKPAVTPVEPDASKMGSVTKEDLKKLEILFGQSAATNEVSKLEGGTKEDSFYDSIGKVEGIEEVTVETPSTIAQKWLTENDPSYHPETSTFTSTDTKYVDAAHEVIFTNLAMERLSQVERASQKGSHSYVIMPHFLSSSATSFEKFSSEVTNIIGSVRGLKGKVSVNVFHSEHVDAEKRCPVPVFVIQWQGHDEGKQSST